MDIQTTTKQKNKKKIMNNETQTSTGGHTQSHQTVTVNTNPSSLPNFLWEQDKLQKIKV